MEKLKFRKIEDIDLIDTFVEKIEKFTDVRLPMNYVRNSTIVGAFLQNRLVGGYMLVNKPLFRSLLFVPDQIKQSNSFFRKDQYEMLEVNGVWLGPSLKTPKMQFRFWMKLVSDIILSKKKYLLLMSNLRNRNIQYLHSLSEPEVLYEGSPNLMAGDNSHETIRVGFTTRYKVLFNIPKYWIELQKRQQRAKQFEQGRKTVRVNFEFGETNATQ